jgi:NDP-sugar pyrophosphorylase family protein
MMYQVVIPMTGVGQRFVDAGYQELKPLIQIAEKTIIEHVLNMFKTADKVVCIVSENHAQRNNLISEILRLRPDALIKQISAHKLGPGHAILEAQEFIEQSLPTLVAYCDWGGEWNIQEMLNQLTNHSGSILTYTGFHPHMMRSTKFAYVRKSGDLVIDIQEKESFTDSPMDEEASSGCYGFATGALLIDELRTQIARNENLNGEYYISLTYKNMLRNNKHVGTVLMKKFYQWGTPEDVQDWEYWNKAVTALPGSIKKSIAVHNIILAAGKGTRIAKIANESKPNLRIAGQHLWEYSSPSGITFKNTKIITREEVGLVLRNDVEVITIPMVTEGQAITAKIGIESIDEQSPLPVNVLSSDNAFTPEIFLEAFNVSARNAITIWTSNNYPLSQLTPKHYAWINLKDKKVIKKDTPPNFLDWELITGNFTFSNRAIALSLINELVDRNIRVNDEFYLDSLIEIAFERELNIETIAIRNFLAVGTPEEYLTYQYFRKDNSN